MHVSERERTSNTARVLEMALPHCEVLVIGQKDAPFAGFSATKDTPTYLLFPEASAPVLSREFLSTVRKTEESPLHLVVPDGTWSQARRIVQRTESLMKIPRLQLGVLEKTQYVLRRNGREGGVCTAEAVAHALGVIEGEEIKRGILDHFYLMRDSILKGRNPPRGSRTKTARFEA